jgi:sortase (surface protein transpeptidase)
VWWLALLTGLASIAVALGGQGTPQVPLSVLGQSPASAVATSSDDVGSADAGSVVSTAAPEAPSPRPLGAPGTPDTDLGEVRSELATAPGRAPDRPRSGRPADQVAPTSTPGQPVTPAAAEGPASLSIPAIGVTSVLNPVGLNRDGTLEVPARGPRYDEAAWFHGSPVPGEVGPAVLLGHVDGTGGTPSVFFDLARLAEGDRVAVTDGDGSTSTFEVYRTQRYAKDDFPTMAVYGDTAGPELRLITCGGSWDSSTGHYRDNTVVYARMVTS